MVFGAGAERQIFAQSEVEDSRLLGAELDAQRIYTNIEKGTIQMVYCYTEKYNQNYSWDENPEEVSAESIGRRTIVVEYVDDWRRNI